MQRLISAGLGRLRQGWRQLTVSLLGGVALSEILRWGRGELLKDFFFGSINDLLRGLLGHMLSPPIAEAIATFVVPYFLGFAVVGLIALYFYRHGRGKTMASGEFLMVAGALLFIIGAVIHFSPQQTAKNATEDSDGHTEVAPAKLTGEPNDEQIEASKKISTPVEWQFDNWSSIFGTNTSHDGDLLISYYRIIGNNISDEPIRNVEAYVIPEGIGERLSLMFVIRGELVDPKDTFGIPPGAKFSLAHKIPASDSRNPQGVVVEEYLEKYGGFIFVFKYGDGKTIERTFSYDEVREGLIKMDDRHNEQHKSFPEARKKD